MSQTIGSTSFFQTYIPATNDTADIAQAFRWYHFGINGTESDKLGVSGYLYKLTNNPKLYGTLNMYSGASDSSPGNTSTFSVVGSSGNTIIGGTLSLAGNFGIATNKFTVDSATGNTIIAGTLGVTGLLTASNGISGTITSGNYTVYQTSSGSIAGQKKIFVADPAVVGSTGSGLVGAVVGDLWFW